MGLFGTKAKKTIVKTVGVKEYAKMIHIFFKKIGINPSDNRLRQPDTLGWWIGRGSAIVYILINQDGENSTIRIVSPILYLPDDFILPFYRRLLELNLDLVNCAIAVSEDRILVVSERPLVGLDQKELEHMIGYLSSVADNIDDKLSEEFNAPMYTRS